MVQISVSPPLVGRVIQECRAEIVEAFVHSVTTTGYQVERLRIPGSGPTAQSVAERYLDMLYTFLGATDPAARDGAREQILAYRRALGRHCAEDDRAQPDELLKPPKFIEIISRVLLARYAAGLSADELLDAFATLNKLGIDMSMALVYGYMSYKEEVLAEQRATLSRLLDELTQVEARERGALALDLHDNLAQRLVTLFTDIQQFERLVAQDPPAAHKQLQRLERRVVDTIRNVRGLIRDLHLGVASRSDGFAALADYVSDLEADTSIRHDYRVTGSVALPPAQEAQVIRIIQEALHNACKHAAADHIETTIVATDETLVCTVRDNGRGFRVTDAIAQSSTHGHFGLSSMQERAQFLGAALDIESAPGCGTAVRLSLERERRHD